MPAATAPATPMERVVFSVHEAARLLRVPTTTLRRWLDGQERKGRFYPPVVRLEPTGSNDVTWGEFVEAGFLREYRWAGSTLPKLRLLIDDLRAESPGLLYPLAMEKPWIDEVSKELFRKAEEAGAPTMLIERGPRRKEGGRQLVWAEPVQEYLRKVVFDAGIAHRYYPLRQDGLVVIDPEVSFGAPQVFGIRTERLVEAHDAGESVWEIAEQWKLDTKAVEQALRWERELLVAA